MKLTLHILFLLFILLTNCNSSINVIELDSLILLALKNPEPYMFDKATRNIEISPDSCCIKVIRNDSITMKCIKGKINGKIAQLDNKKDVPWVISMDTNSVMSIIPCASSYKIYGEINIEKYLTENSFQIIKKHCGKDNDETNGLIVLECIIDTFSTFYIVYEYSTGTGGYDFSLYLHIYHIPPDILSSTKPCDL